MLPNFKAHYKVTVLETVLALTQGQTQRTTEQKKALK